MVVHILCDSIPKYSKFRTLNFCCLDGPRKYFNSDFFLIYGVVMKQNELDKGIYSSGSCNLTSRIFHTRLAVMVICYHYTQQLESAETTTDDDAIAY